MPERPVGEIASEGGGHRAWVGKPRIASVLGKPRPFVLAAFVPSGSRAFPFHARDSSGGHRDILVSSGWGTVWGDISRSRFRADPSSLYILRYLSVGVVDAPAFCAYSTRFLHPFHGRAYAEQAGYCQERFPRRGRGRRFGRNKPFAAGHLGDFSRPDLSRSCRPEVWAAYRRWLTSFGPTFADEKQGPRFIQKESRNLAGR